MVICQYFQRGKCNFGSLCKNEHVGGGGGFGGSGSFGSFGSSNNQQAQAQAGRQTSIAAKTPAEQLKADLTEEIPLYKWSCYGLNERGNAITGTDLSPEEMRWAFTKEFKETGQVGSATKTVLDLQQSIDAQIKLIFQNAAWVLNGTGPLVRPAAAPISSFPTPATSTISSFGGASAFASNPFGSSSNTQQQQSVFGKSSFVSGAAFGGGATGPATSGFSFSAAANKPSAVAFGGSAFGTTATQPSAFGAAATQASAFGTTATQPSAFGAAATQASAFGTTATQQSAFGAAATQASAFGTTATQPSAFGAAATQPSAFGAAPAQTSSTFGASIAKPSAFGTAQTANSSAFGTAALQPSAFGAATAQTPSAFGSTPAAPSGFASTAFGTQQQPIQTQQQQNIASSSLFGSTGGLLSKASTSDLDLSNGMTATTLSLLPVTMSPQQIEGAFRSAKFEFGLIPEVPPPK